MFETHPVIPLIFSIIAVAIIIKQSIVKHEVLKYRLMISFLVVFILAFECIFYSDIKADTTLNNISTYSSVGFTVLLAVFFFFSVEASLTKNNFEREVVLSLDDSKYYVLLDKKEKVKDISSLFAKELGYSKKECLGKRLADLFDRNLNVLGFNGEETNNQMFFDYLSDIKNRCLEGNHNSLEIMYETKHNDEGALYLSESPLYVMGNYNGRLLIGDKKGEEALAGMEHDLVESNKELEAIKLRFLTLLENASEGISFVDIEEGSIWCNDSLASALNLNGNSLPVKDFRSLIHPDDLELYLAKIANLTSANPNFEFTYRFKTGAYYSFVKEIGRRIFGKNIDEIVSVSNVIRNNHYERTTISELDNILSEPDLLARAEAYQVKNKPYQLGYFKVSSIPDINEKFGRNVGNMALSEYVKMIHNNFVNDNQIYRIGGLDFVAIISDLRKMDVLKNYLENHEKILHLDSRYGALEIHLEVFMGVALSSDFNTAKDCYKASLDALKFALKPQVQANYAYYKDIK